MRLLIVVLFFLSITSIFYFASGTLSLRRLTLASLTYYVYLFMTYLGASFIYLGFAREHYIIATLSEAVIEQTYFFCAWCGLGLGLSILLVNILFGGIAQRDVVARFYSSTCALSFNRKMLYSVVVSLVVIGGLATAYTFVILRSIPLIDLIRFGSDDAALTRIAATRNFSGNIYIRNIGMSTIAPLASYCAYAGFLLLKSRKWRNLFFLSAIIAVLALTWNLEKGPVAFYFIYLFLLRMLLDSRKLAWKTVAKVAVVVAFVITAGYVLTSGELFSLSLASGPISRIVITPVASVARHLQCFPDLVGFLNGESLPSLLANLFGVDEGWNRSGRVVMEVFNARGIEAGTAGVMNAFFPCEAYANWGVGGAAISVIIVGAFVSIAQNLIMRGQKNVFRVLVLIVLIDFQVTTLNGGFVDYLYNVNLYTSLFIVWFASRLCVEEKSGRFFDNPVSPASVG